MASVELRGIVKAFGRTAILQGIDLAARDGEFLTLVGPSGCGKSTLLRIIAGLESQDAGAVAIGGSPVDHLRPAERNVAMVFQSYALYPHLSAFDNIATPLMMQRLALAERLPVVRALSPRRRRIMRGIAQEVRAVATQLRIADLLARKPGQLSGGQRQRVALGRAMVRAPAVFLMDEPLSNLDASLRVHMRSELAELHARLGATFIYVTHDQVEAMTMSDRVAVMDGGVILQLGTPGELYERPADLRVARFIGSPAINVLAGTADGRDGIALACGARLALEIAAPRGTALNIAIRPEALRPTRPGVGGDGGADAMLLARLRRIENLGAERLLHCDLPAPQEATILARVAAAEAAAAAFAPGERIAFPLDTAACHVFGPEGARLEPVRAAPPALQRAQAGAR
jgi:multiple sugar transport system ATP-binding protein